MGGRTMAGARLVMLMALAMAAEFPVMAQQLKFTDTVHQQVCKDPVLPSQGGKRVYNVGVLAHLGAAEAILQHNLTFTDYLTLAVGHKFDPPISFRMVAKEFGEQPLDYFTSSSSPNTNNMAQSLSPNTNATEEGADFIFTQAAMFSCVDMEVGATSLATNIATSTFNGTVHHLTQYGGVIFVKDDEDAADIQRIQDIQGKRVAASSMISLGSGQLQFLELQRAGVHYLNGPSQIIFTDNQQKVVDEVLLGHVDVGFVRTSTLERSIDNRTGTGVPLDLSLLRILNVRENQYTSYGPASPFVDSTDLSPEWNIAARSHVPSDVARLVQESLLDMAKHAAAAKALMGCTEAVNCTATDSDCVNTCFDYVEEFNATSIKSCDTTPELALLAQKAMKAAKISGWRTSLSFSSTRVMQEHIGAIEKDDETGNFRCRRAETLYDSVVCPEGYFKKNDQDIANGCQDAGLDCYGYQCICSPCVQAFEVEFYPVYDRTDNVKGSGCAKLASCGYVEQGYTIDFRVNDNMKRKDAKFYARASIGEATELYEFEMLPRANNETDLYIYQVTFDATSRQVGTFIMEVLVDGAQIPESPFRVTIDERDCEAEDPLRTADAYGNCVCSLSLEVGSYCVSVAVLLSLILVPLVVLIGLAAFLYARRKRKEADALWMVDLEELKMGDPVKILGRGTFGLVLEAEYRGTVVAVKRVLPPAHVDSGNLSKASFSGKFSLKSNTAVLSHWNTQLSSTMSTERISLSSEVADEEQAKPGGQGVLRGLFSLGEHEKLKKAFVQEMRVIAQLRHPNITTVMGAVIAKEPMLVMECMQFGSLYDLIHNESIVVDGELALPILQDIAKGLRFLHFAKTKIIHGDLKAANVLVDSRFRAKVSDFGLSQKNKLRGNACGTPYWMAPELLRGESRNTTASDMYSFGMVIYELLSGKEPYAGEKTMQVLEMVADRSINKRPPIPPNCPTELADLMKACLSGEPMTRPDAEVVDKAFLEMDVSTVDAGIMSPAGGTSRAKNRNEMTPEQLYSAFPKHIAEVLKKGEKVQPESHACVTILILEVLGTVKVDKLYAKLDALRRSYGIFRIESANEKYMCATNFATPQENHTEIMAKFALEAIDAAETTLVDVDDPSQGCMSILVGMQDGPVVSHVIGSKSPRLSVIGDAVNTAASIQKLGKRNVIHCTQGCASKLEDQHLGLKIVVPRRTLSVQGKGEMVTCYINRERVEATAAAEKVPTSFVSKNSLAAYGGESVTKKLIDWNVSVMGPLILRIVALRQHTTPRASRPSHRSAPTPFPGSTVTVFDEVQEIVELPEFDPKSIGYIKEVENEMLPRKVTIQLREYVTAIARLYNNANPFHNFEHATNVIKALISLLNQVVSPENIMEEIGSDNVETMHQYTCGISSDPLTQFACVFSALIHDCDHPGVPNARLVVEKHELAAYYKGVSIAEQNSVDLAWNLLMQPAFSDLLSSIAASQEEVARFRQLVVNIVLATDLVDQQLKDLRNRRWKRAFSEDEFVLDSFKSRNDRKATIVLEHMIQAADVSHTMSHWDVYRKWNECFFLECYDAYKQGRADTDPSLNWYKGELGFFDFYIVPLAKKLFECEVFGESSYVFLDYAMQNRANWEQVGNDVVAEMLANYENSNVGKLSKTSNGKVKVSISPRICYIDV